MVNNFFLSESEYNERLIEVLVEKVFDEIMKESSALEIARDMWKCSTGVFCKNERATLDNMWANALMRKVISRRNESFQEVGR